ncbi:NAD-dependent epimerase/dehydratase family protein [Deinococcus radiotolerans]|uniref:Epimerase n=1 Tax=Deinococcus radiotolerans TaxID=1309407 RepID=A0ABQ2FLY4_9DEIO|nr:NAD-dependent epimerase/dehydratase family protein [Deinococcus radiotolerans]GGL09619.1 epimerase [Deinococcus radiotolerans]
MSAEDLFRSHALVTGGAGFIGSHLVDRLLAEGWRVTVIDNFDPFYDPAIKRRNVAEHLNHPAYQLIPADLRTDPAELRRAIRGDVHVCVHLAALAGVRPSFARPTEYLDVNVVGTQNMLELARALGVRQFIFASSSSVYGTCPSVPWREDERNLHPISPYAASKLSGELLGQVCAHVYGIRFVALRFFTVYGPRQRPDLAIHAFARRMLNGQPINVFGNGHSRRDYTYVRDIVDGIVQAIEYDLELFKVINLGNNHTISLMDMIEVLEDVLGVRAHLRHLPEQFGDVPQTWADVEVARRLLGYAPRTQFYDGVQAFMTWLREDLALSPLPQPHSGSSA